MDRFSEYNLETRRLSGESHEVVPDVDTRHLPLTYNALGLGGEAGEVLELVKKSLRTGGSLDVAEVALELGDVLWYASKLARQLGFSIADVAAINIAKLRSRHENGKQPEAELAMAKAYLSF